MSRRVEFHAETWPLKEPFQISRGVKTEVTVTVAEVSEGAHKGRGESVPYAHYGENAEAVIAAMKSVQKNLELGCSRADLLGLLPAGAARNALDCALWDLEAKIAGRTAFDISGAAAAREPNTALTIGIDTAERMAAKAVQLKDCKLLKVKIDREQVVEKIRKIREAAPSPRMIVDPNESWDIELLEQVHKDLAALGVDMLEQPLPAGKDEALQGFVSAVPLCADESCHTRADLPRLKGRYDIINIKLDKTGGLTEALALKNQAESMGFRIMIGCMIGTSLSMAPALLLAEGAEFLDLDGPVWMERDRDGGLNIDFGAISPPSAEFWG
ncbi:N-acetyl-D-Glu racemase DgcA [Kordiimonas sp.]|uniref:N-acetyl-D-Glu racemase DgcA n=1 Tax=Kordiimonas sp. TaxID=1970157 RepID=UPI003A906F1F